MSPHYCTDEPGEAQGTHGSVLVIVILVLLAVSALATTMIFVSQGDQLMAAHERDSERAYFASRSGLSYAFQQYQAGAITPTTTGAAFDSFGAGVTEPLKGAEFTGVIYDASGSTGKLFRIESNGRYDKASRKTELVFQIVPEAFKYGYVAFNGAVLHNHSGLAGPLFKIESTIFSNGSVLVPENITLDGSIVAGGMVQVDIGSTVNGDIFANSLVHSGTINGQVKLVTAVSELSPGAAIFDRLDILGGKYEWYNGASMPGSVIGGGSITGSQGSYTIQNGDEFRSSIFRRNGSLLSNPDVNVVKFVSPPKLDYKEMKAEADLSDATYFTSMSSAMAYLATQRVNEVINGQSVTTIRVGAVGSPEFIYVAGDFLLTLCPTVPVAVPPACPDPGVPSLYVDDLASGILIADGFDLEGGIYASGNFEFHGPEYDPTYYPAPPDYYSLRINALDYCLPAIVTYPQPTTGTVASWTPNDTPVMTGGVSDLDIRSEVTPHEGFVSLSGVTYSEGETHVHHTESADELVTFNGAELGYEIHNCDWFQFTYDPMVLCTQFLVAGEGTTEVVSYRELR